MKSATRIVAHVIFFVFMFALCLKPATAQDYYNPDPEPCGLPDRGPIAVTVTYNLTADCTMDGSLYTHHEPAVTLTINGNGYTITPYASSYHQGRGIWIKNASSKLVLKNVTLDGALRLFQGMIYSEGTIDLDNVTIRPSRTIFSTAIISKGDATLDNTLFEDLTNFDNNLTTSGLTAMTSDGAAVLTNTVVRGAIGGAGVLGAGAGGSMTLNGCATFSGIIAKGILSSVTDNTGGMTCTGTIGNGDKAVDPPATLACGLPGQGVLAGNKTYNMTASCVIGESSTHVAWHVPKDANIVINGNGNQFEARGHIITGPGSTLTLNNVIAKKTLFTSFGALNVQNSILDASRITVYGSLVMANSSAVNQNTYSHALSGDVNGVGAPSVTIRDSAFRSNSADQRFPVLQMYDGAMTLEGCITAENGEKALYDTRNTRITDNSTGPCASDETIGPAGFTIARLRAYTAPAPPPVSAPEPEVVISEPLPQCFQALGILGVICRDQAKVHLGSEIRDGGVDGAGSVLLQVTPRQVEAAQRESLIASSSDGRAAAYITGPRCVVRDEKPRVRSHDCIAGQLKTLREADGERIDSGQRFIILSLGLTDDGKTLSVIFDHDLSGHIIGTVATVTGLPGIPAATSETRQATPPQAASPAILAPYVTPQPARADGAIVHVVQPGDTLSGIAVAYKVALSAIASLNGLTDINLIYADAELLVKPASS